MKNNTEQWLSDGNCDMCRRKKYCGKQCKANKGFMMRQAMQLGAQFAAQILYDNQNKTDKK